MFKTKLFASASAAVLFFASEPVAIAGQAATGSSAANTASTALTIGPETVMVSAARTPWIANVLTSVDVLSGTVAQRQTVNHTFELFQRLPGVLTTGFGQGNNNNGAISMRGFNGEGGVNAVKMIIDGVPANVNDGFAWMMDSVMTMDISQVQVVRGTSDARYGLHNIAGNVNIFTRQGGNYQDVRVLGGSFGTYDAQAAAGYESGKFSQNYFLGFNHSDGQRQHAVSERVSGSAKWFANLGDYKVGLNVRYSNSYGSEPGYLFVNDIDRTPNVSYPTSAFDGASREIGRYSLHLDGQPTSNLQITSNLYLVDYSDSRFVRFAANFPQQERQTSQTQYGGMFALHYVSDTTWLHAFAVDAGADFQIQDNRYQRYRTVERVRQFQQQGHNFSFNNYGAYVQAVIEPTEWLKITPAYRFDTVSGDFRNTLTNTTFAMNDYGTIGQPKISAAITPMPDVTIYANYGRTFQIGLGASSYLIPPQNVSVAPSYNDGWESGVKYRLVGWLEARAAVWQQYASGEVRFNELDSTFQNIGKTRREGYDLQVTFNPDNRLSGWLSFSQQRGIIVVPDPSLTLERAGNRIDHVPEILFTAGADYRATDQLRFSVTVNAQSDYHIDTSNLNGQFGGYFLINTEVGYLITPRMELSLLLRNLTDDRYPYVWWDGGQSLHAPANGRAIYGILRYTM